MGVAGDGRRALPSGGTSGRPAVSRQIRKAVSASGFHGAGCRWETAGSWNVSERRIPEHSGECGPEGWSLTAVHGGDAQASAAETSPGVYAAIRDEERSPTVRRLCEDATAT